MTDLATTPSVRFELGRCEPSLVVRSVIAAVDHLCAEAGVTLSLLDALELPITEVLTTLETWSIAAIDVSVVDTDLQLRITTDQPVDHDLADALGESSDIVDSFFELAQSGTVTELRGSLT